MKRVKLLKSQIISIITAVIFFLIAVGFGVLYLVKVNDKDNTPPTTLTPPSTIVDSDDGNVDYDMDAFKVAVNKTGEKMMKYREETILQAHEFFASNTFMEPLSDGQSSNEIEILQLPILYDPYLFTELSYICYSITEYFANYVDEYTLDKIYTADIDIFQENRDVKFISKQNAYGYEFLYSFDSVCPISNEEKTPSTHYVHILIEYDFEDNLPLKYISTVYNDKNKVLDYFSYDLSLNIIQSCTFDFIDTALYEDIIKKDLDFLKKNISIVSFFDSLISSGLSNNEVYLGNIKESDFSESEILFIFYYFMRMYVDMDFAGINDCFDLYDCESIVYAKDRILNNYSKKYTIVGTGVEPGVDGNDHYQMRGKGFDYCTTLMLDEIAKIYILEDTILDLDEDVMIYSDEYFVCDEDTQYSSDDLKTQTLNNNYKFELNKDVLLESFSEEVISLLIDWYQNDYEEDKFYYEPFKIGDYEAFYYQSNDGTFFYPLDDSGDSCLILYKIDEANQIIEYYYIGELAGNLETMELTSIHITSDDTIIHQISYDNTYSIGYSFSYREKVMSLTYNEVIEAVHESDESTVELSADETILKSFSYGKEGVVENNDYHYNYSSLIEDVIFSINGDGANSVTAFVSNTKTSNITLYFKG